MKIRKPSMPSLAWTALFIVVLMFAVPMVYAATLANDDAAQSVYNDGWQTGDNGGTGMGAWTLTNTSGTGSQNGHFIAVNNSNCNIESSTRCWAMYANNDQTASATREFADPMNVGDKFTIFMDNGFIDDGKSVGFGLQNTDSQNLLEFYFVGGDSSYMVNDNTGPSDSGVAFTDEGLKIEITLGTNAAYTMKVTRLANSFVANLSGSHKNPSGEQAIDRLRLFNFSAGSQDGGVRDAFFNSILLESGQLAITLADFHAVQQGDAVLVTWETASELNNRGVNLYRGTSPDGWDRQLNTALIPSQSQGSPSGFVYTWEDRAGLVAGTTYYYWLQDVDLSGALTMHGPVSAAFVVPTAVTLNGVSASPAAGAAALPWLWVVAAAGAALALGRRR